MDLRNLYGEITMHLLHDEMPSQYFNTIDKEPFFQRYPFDMLEKLKDTKQSPIHHPEGNVWNHTILVIDKATQVKHKSKHPAAFMWAALLHDIGKPSTTKQRGDKVTAYDHDKVGSKLVRKFLKELTDDHGFIQAVETLVRWHMQILFVVNDLPFADIKTMKQQIDIQEIALLGLCDRLGRTNIDRAKEEKNIAMFIQKCNRE